MGNKVVKSSSIEVGHRKRCVEPVWLGEDKLPGMPMRYSRGEQGIWSVVHMPSVKEADARWVHRKKQNQVC